MATTSPSRECQFFAVKRARSASTQAKPPEPFFCFLRSGWHAPELANGVTIDANSRRAYFGVGPVHRNGRPPVCLVAVAPIIPRRAMFEWGNTVGVRFARPTLAWACRFPLHVRTHRVEMAPRSLFAAPKHY